MFLDEHKIKTIAGKGGDGCVSFRREKFVPRGGPNGGDGGEGGNVIIKVNSHLNTLGHLAHKKVFKANKGDNGKGKNMHGKNAEDLVIEVPPGTIIFNEDKSEMLADLGAKKSQITVVKGGKGGMGNARFVSSTNQIPRFAEQGEPGEEKEIILELKLVADVGIIGLPSAGKSTLISVISNAKPKIAAYHFTTLAPNLGVVNMSKYGGSINDNFVVADIPGLIEGASQGKGLGLQFLKHISRTQLLVHLFDGSLDNLAENYKVIMKELKSFSKELATKEQIIVINKTDLLSEKELAKKIKELKKATKKTEILTISAAGHQNLKPLLFEISDQLIKLKQKPKPEESAKESMPIFRPHLNKSSFEIEKIIRKKDHKIFRITGAKIEQIAVMTDIKNREGLERMYHYMSRLGIQKAIEKKGATFGDFITIKGKKIPYRK